MNVDYCISDLHFSWVILLHKFTELQPVSSKSPVSLCVQKELKKLTFHDELDPLADAGRDLVAGYAEVRSHLLPRHILAKHIKGQLKKKLETVN